MIYHVYDVDGGFGDSVTEEKLIGMTTDEKLAYAYVEKYDDGTGTLARRKKKSFDWYAKVIKTNGEDLA